MEYLKEAQWLKKHKNGWNKHSIFLNEIDIDEA